MRTLTIVLLMQWMASFAFAQENKGKFTSENIAISKVPEVVKSSQETYFKGIPVGQWKQNTLETKKGDAFIRYVAWFKHNQKQLARAEYLEDGTGKYGIVYYAASGTPQVIKNAVANLYDGFKLTGSQHVRILTSDKESYRVTLHKGFQKLVIWLDSNGKELSKEFVAEAYRDLWGLDQSSEDTTEEGRDSTSESDANNSREEGTFIDERDGQEYKWVKVGQRIWMAENLAYLPKVNKLKEGSEDQDGKGKYYYVYGYDGDNVNTAKATENYKQLGVLYNWNAALTACPKGWHLPNEFEWRALELTIGMKPKDLNQTGSRGEAGLRLKMHGENYWNDYNTAQRSNPFGFSAIVSGYRTHSAFTGISTNAPWWTSTPDGKMKAWYRYVFSGNKGIYRQSGGKEGGICVRCIKNK